MKKFYPFLLLLGVFAFIGYMESPQMKPEDSLHYPVSTEKNETEAVAADVKDDSKLIMELELVHEGMKMVDGTKVEAYREYEIYKDRDGNIVKEVPTEHYNYLGYE
ncbi:hypothetical protein [Halobacillus aidingensis]|uniref:Uncharacterized protein n=1 Tax=Halobacillus aidingensis TaxID=240303 RepID=A0A1H0K398_HALAD|nr:hypothetical protein [Halobacillus aidingensis]SDO50233.1 hypothetical protein SAMN05421677_105204 [Halobacillus aidingensis]